MPIDFDSINENYSKYEVIYNNIVDVTKRYLKIKSDLIISVTICDNEFIHKVNKEYRKIDRPTDVISFAFLDGLDHEVLKKKGQVVLGDIYISFEKAKEQANEYKHSEDREFMFLFTHGLLHLIGYDHMTKEDEEVMFPLQEEILNAYKKEYGD